MDITLDSDLSEQLKYCKPGEAITLTGTVSSNDAGTVEIAVDTAESSDEEEVDEGGEGSTEGQSEEPSGPEEQPALPGPVKMLLKRR